MIDSDADQFLRGLRDPTAQSAREQYCRSCASAIESCGNVLWAFGLAEEDVRRATAMVLQMAGSLALGSIAMLEAENWYASSALVRQLIETEYLLFRFATDPTEATRWLSATSTEIRRLFGPGAMRKRSDTKFRVEEYAAHCDHGGHPNPRSAYMLPEHSLVPATIPLGSFNAKWFDLAQHLERVVRVMATSVRANGMAHVGLVSQALNDTGAALERWETEDPCTTFQINVPAGTPP
jgi:hypothetical protein